MKILIADDHDLFRDSLSALLREEDPNVDITLAANVGVAMYALNAKKDFDVILLDMCMPGMNGLEGAKEVKTKAKDTPVVLISGSAISTLAAKAKAVGLQGFLPKTLSGKSLLSALKLVSSGEDFFSLNRGQKTVGKSHLSLTLPDWSPA